MLLRSTTTSTACGSPTGFPFSSRLISSAHAARTAATDGITAARATGLTGGTNGGGRRVGWAGGRPSVEVV